MKAFYQKEVKEIFEELNTNEAGLTKEEVVLRREKYGSNELEETKAMHPFMVFLTQFKDLLVIILIVAAIISMISGETESTIVILAVISMNAILGTIQTIKAQKSLDSLKQLSTPHTRVIRDGETMEVSSNELMVGDIMLLEAGDVVGADARIIENYSLQVNESALTGEVESVHKQVETIVDECGLGDQKDMVFSSGLVTYGRAKTMITAIGMNTEIGKIATLMNTTKERKTPLQRTLDDFSKKLSIVILFICALVFGLNIMQGNPVLDALMFAVALAVAAIPEALASIVTIVLAMGTSQMAKENAIIKNINSVESLGCVSVICSDKTGTLTQNKMSAQQVYRNNELIDAQNMNEASPLDRMMMLGFALCCDAQTTESQRIGDPTELALVDLLEVYHIDELETRKKYQRIDENPFDSERKLMSTLHLIDGKNTLLLKGACDEILKKATHIQTASGVHVIEDGDVEKILAMNEGFAENGLRVLGFAYREVTDQKIGIEDEENLIFLGLISLMDPPRVESKVAVENCLRAGITPVMITGDHKVTARSIAKSLGIYKDGDECLDGTQLNAMSEEELMERLEHITVYARVAPEHKIRIVNAWQKKNNIVAMTGDGVNDAPALKQSDIGIAMGITGTEVSKDAASMILTDDNFATIVKAVATGRNIYANIKNSIIYLLSGNLSGIICVLASSLMGLKVPFLPVHLLFINLVTDSLPAIAIGMEHSTKDILKEKPRDAKEGILTSDTMKQLGFQGILIAVVTMIAYFTGLKESWAIATTMAFSTLCLARLFHGFNCRSKRSLYRIGFFSNKYSILAFLVGFVFLTCILMIPQLHSLFSVTTISMEQLLLIYALALTPTIIIQGVKMVQHL
ncbi:MAG: cation-translocating P-type ATPase [Longicatena sp.]